MKSMISINKKDTNYNTASNLNSKANEGGALNNFNEIE